MCRLDQNTVTILMALRIKVQVCATVRPECIDLDKILSKAMLVEGHENNMYVIRQPNKYDHN